MVSICIVNTCISSNERKRFPGLERTCDRLVNFDHILFAQDITDMIGDSGHILKGFSNVFD